MPSWNFFLAGFWKSKEFIGWAELCVRLSSFSYKNQKCVDLKQTFLVAKTQIGFQWLIRRPKWTFRAPTNQISDSLSLGNVLQRSSDACMMPNSNCCAVYAFPGVLDSHEPTVWSADRTKSAEQKLQFHIQLFSPRDTFVKCIRRSFLTCGRVIRLNFEWVTFVKGIRGRFLTFARVIHLNLNGTLL